MEGKITISRPCYGDGREVISIRVKDNTSRTRFLDIEIKLDDFTRAVTGQSEMPIEFAVNGLDRVGKKKITERRSLKMPFLTYDTKLMGSYLSNNWHEEGWILDPYLGSKGSVDHDDGMPVLNFSVFRFVEGNADAE